MTPESLEKLQDDELRFIISRSHEILGDRDRKTKEKAMEDALVILSRAGLTPEDLAGKSKTTKRKLVKRVTYHSGHQYQHPTNKTLIWNAKGQKPNWLRELEKGGGKAIKIAEAVQK